MPENVNTSALACEGFADANDGRDVMVNVDHVTMIFNMANEQLNNLKEYAIALARRELMFKEFRALDDVSFQVKRGDVFGILGTNGSGKSTVLKIIAGVLESSRGTCTVNGDIAPLIELGAGFDMELTARENIFLNGALLGYSKKFIEQHFDEIVEFAEVEKFLDMPMKNYSSGMVARIAFAIATVIVPEILIVDEVLSVGDFMFQKKCEDRIQTLIKEHNVTVLIVSHSNDQIERLCNKAVWIEKGHLRMAGNAHDVCQTYRLLGGHTGSPEAEDLVLRTFTSNVEPQQDMVRALEADTRSGLAVRLASEAFPDGSDAVVLVSGVENFDAYLVQGLAGALNAPVLVMRNDSLPDLLVRELQRLAPSHVVMVGRDELAWDALQADVKQALPDDGVKVEHIAAPDYQQLSLAVYEYGCERSLWGSDAVLTYTGCMGDISTFSAFIYANRVPVLCKDNDVTCEEAWTGIAKQGSISRVFAMGGEVKLPSEWFATNGMELVRFCGTDPFDACETINAWLDENTSQDEMPKQLAVVSAWDPGDSFGLGAYAARTGARVWQEVPQNLESVARAIRYVQRDAGRYEHITFVAERNRFNAMDKQILAKAVSAVSE